MLWLKPPLQRPSLPPLQTSILVGRGETNVCVGGQGGIQGCAIGPKVTPADAAAAVHLRPTLKPQPPLTGPAADK